MVRPYTILCWYQGLAAFLNTGILLDGILDSRLSGSGFNVPDWKNAHRSYYRPRYSSNKSDRRVIDRGISHKLDIRSVWVKRFQVQGCILVPGLHLGCVYTKKAYASSGLIQNLEPNWQLFGKMSISNERRLWPRASSLIGKETLQFGIGLFVDCGSGF